MWLGRWRYLHAGRRPCSGPWPGEVTIVSINRIGPYSLPKLAKYDPTVVNTPRILRLIMFSYEYLQSIQHSEKHTYWVPQKYPQIYTVIVYICIGKEVWFSVYICGNLWNALYILTELNFFLDLYIVLIYLLILYNLSISFLCYIISLLRVILFLNLVTLS